jgi:hypothetical protein
MTEGDPGVPEAVGRALDELSFRIPPTEIDRVWIFPPLRRGRKETGVLAAGCYAPEGRHLLVTVAYRAEETGRGVQFEATVHEEGEAPPDRLPRIMTGVVRRLREEDPGDPRSEELAGNPVRFLALAEALAVPVPPLDPVRNAQEMNPS